ncbi:hypothetical protein NXV13_04195 [Bacteroides ovatus]|nr:hypothetical protein [Bacteroides ovatus]MCS2812993.1 hypothetical protein [Bacteroides ovatus]
MVVSQPASGRLRTNYATAFSSMLVDDLHFVYLLRQKYMQEFYRM